METTQEIKEVVKFKNASHRLYKGKNSGDGAASQWSLSVKPSKRDKTISDVSLFLELAPQNGKNENEDYTFDWKRWEDGKAVPNKSVSVKLGLPDIGEMLTVLNNVNKGVGKDGKGLFHNTDNSQTTIYFSLAVSKEGEPFGYNLRLSNKNKTTNDQNSVSHFISFAEGEVLRTLFNSAVLQMTKWQLV